MLRKTLILAVAAALLTLCTASRAHAWGAMHVGYTHFGYGGVEHYGRTVGVGPYGGFSTARVGGVGYGGVYHAGYGVGGVYGADSFGGGYRYGVSPYGGYSAGAFRTYSPYGLDYGAGVYRAY
jgi:hypothetical protein